MEKNKINEEYEDVTQMFSGKTLFVRSCSDKWVTVKTDLPDSPVYCNESEPLDSGRITICEMSDGWCALRGFNGKYLSVRMDCHDKMSVIPFGWMGSNPLFDGDPDEILNEYIAPLVFANADEPQIQELFKIYKVGKYYGIKAKCNNRWLFCWWDSRYGSEELAAISFGFLFDGEGMLFDLVEPS